MHISGKRLIILATMLMLSLITMLYTVYDDIRVSYRESFEEISVQLQKKQLISLMFSAARQRSLSLFGMYHATGSLELDELFQGMSQQATIFIDARDGLFSMELTDSERAVLQSQDLEIKKNVELHNEVAELLLNGVRNEHSGQLLFQVLASQNRILNTINSIVKHYDKESLSSLIRLQQERERVDQKFVMLAVILLSAAALFMGFLIFYIVSREKIHYQVQLGEQQKAAEKLSYQASHDALTGLINRFSLEERMEQAIYFARRSNAQIAVMMIDMDRFKLVNDTMGTRRVMNC